MMGQQKKEDDDLLKSFENDEWSDVQDIESEKVRYAGYASETFRKDQHLHFGTGSDQIESKIS